MMAISQYRWILVRIGYYALGRRGSTLQHFTVGAQPSGRELDFPAPTVKVRRRESTKALVSDALAARQPLKQRTVWLNVGL